jgi:hypothetical protein
MSDVSTPEPAEEAQEGELQDEGAGPDPAAAPVEQDEG